MTFRFTRLTLLALLALAMLVTATSAQKKPADSDKEPVVKDIMLATHTKTGPLNRIGQAVRGMRWDEAGPLAKELVKAGEDLGKAKPPAKGSPASWTKLVKAYQADTKAAAEAVAKKNIGDFRDAMDSLNASCRTCHSAHK